MIEGDCELAQCAWNYLNDCLRLDLCLRYKAEVIACAAVYMATQVQKFPLPKNVAWWEIMNVDISSLLEIADRILELYQIPKVK